MRGRCIQRRGNARRPASLLVGGQGVGVIRNPKGLRRSIGLVNRLGETPDEQVGPKMGQGRARSMGGKGVYSIHPSYKVFADGHDTEDSCVTPGDLPVSLVDDWVSDL